MLFMLFSSYLDGSQSRGIRPLVKFGAFLKCIALPSLVLAIGELGILIRIVRSSMLTALQQDFGDERKCERPAPLGAIVHYALRSAIAHHHLRYAAGKTGRNGHCRDNFALPGIGRLMLTAVEQRDIILLQGIVLYYLHGGFGIAGHGSGGYGRQPHYPYRRETITGMKKNRAYLSGQVLSWPASQLCIISFSGCLQIQKRWIPEPVCAQCGTPLGPTNLGAMS